MRHLVYPAAAALAVVLSPPAQACASGCSYGYPAYGYEYGYPVGHGYGYGYGYSGFPLSGFAFGNGYPVYGYYGYRYPRYKRALYGYGYPRYRRLYGYGAGIDSGGFGSGPYWQGEPYDRRDIWRYGYYQGNDPDPRIRTQIIRDPTNPRTRR